MKYLRRRPGRGWGPCRSIICPLSRPRRTSRDVEYTPIALLDNFLKWHSRPLSTTLRRHRCASVVGGSLRRTGSTQGTIGRSFGKINNKKEFNRPHTKYWTLNLIVTYVVPCKMDFILFFFRIRPGCVQVSNVVSSLNSSVPVKVWWYNKGLFEIQKPYRPMVLVVSYSRLGVVTVRVKTGNSLWT